MVLPKGILWPWSVVFFSALKIRDSFIFNNPMVMKNGFLFFCILLLISRKYFYFGYSIQKQLLFWSLRPKEPFRIKFGFFVYHVCALKKKKKILMNSVI